ncbi:hypothetical protein PMAYCL1PPCAC_15348, partial [Pristionchus mayeri]
VGSAVVVDGSATRATRMPVAPYIEPNHALLSKYQSQVESHLDKVSLQLDEDIAAMRRKLKEDKAIIDNHNERKTILEKEISKYEMEKLEHDKLFEDTQRKVADREEALLREEILLQTTLDRAQRGKATNDDLRIRLDAANAKIAQLQLHLGGDKERRGHHRGLTRVWEKAREEGQRLAKEKNKQDAHIAQLRKDVTAVDASLKKIREEIVQEIESFESNPKHANQLRERAKAFEDETTIGEDHFGELMCKLKERTAAGGKGDSATVKAIRDSLVKVQKLVERKRNYLEEIVKNSEDTMDRIAKTRAEIERSEIATRKSQSTVTRIRKQYANLRQAKTGFVEDAESTDSELENLDGQHTSMALRTEMLQRQAEEMERLIASSAAARSRKSDRPVRPKTVRPGGARMAHTGTTEESNDTLPTRKTPKKPRVSTAVEKAKSRNVAAKRRATAMKMAKDRLAIQLDEAEARVGVEREEVKEMAQRLKKLEEDRIEVVRNKEKNAIDSVTVETLETREEKRNAERATELQQQRDLVDFEVRELQSQIEFEEQALHDIRKKLEPYEKMDIVAYEEEKKGHAIELRRLKNYHTDLKKAIREKQKELSLSVVQRESAVDKANSTLNLDTSVRAEREREVEEVQKQIEDLEQELHTMGLSAVSL